MSGTGRKITKRACDGCKIRKVKCSGLSPCDGCIAVRISCTYLKTPSARGPRKLRRTTLQKITKTQRRWRNPATSPSTTGATEAPGLLQGPATAPDVRESSSRIPIASLVLHLCVYRLRMFPVWPVVKVEEVIASLQRNEEDVEAYALANAVGAATVAQLKLKSSSLGGDAVTGEAMEAECQRARTMNESGSQLSLSALRTAFFLHVYHENQVAGGVKSLLYLREAITIGQMMGLHKEASYRMLSFEEQQIKRRILWLLFVTERGVAMLHKLPVVLKPNISFPAMDRDDETFVLPAFQKLVNLFWIFDQSGAFDILQDSDGDILAFDGLGSPSRSSLNLLQKQLQEVPVESEAMNDVQTADICVTRQWMRAVLWRFSVNHGLLSLASTDQTTSLSYPFQIAKEFLSVISQLPNSAIEAHGQAMELKIYEIASSVTDAIAKTALITTPHPFWSSPASSLDRPADILYHLHRILSSCRGGNQLLLSLLCDKIAHVHNNQLLLLEPSSRIIEEDDGDDPWRMDSSSVQVSDNMGFSVAISPDDLAAQTGYDNATTPQDHLSYFSDDASPQRPLSGHPSSLSSSTSHSTTIPNITHVQSQNQSHNQSHDQGQNMAYVNFSPQWPFPTSDSSGSSPTTEDTNHHNCNNQDAIPTSSNDIYDAQLQGFSGDVFELLGGVGPGNVASMVDVGDASDGNLLWPEQIGDLDVRGLGQDLSSQRRSMKMGVCSVVSEAGESWT